MDLRLLTTLIKKMVSEEKGRQTPPFNADLVLYVHDGRQLSQQLAEIVRPADEREK